MKKILLLTILYSLIFPALTYASEGNNIDTAEQKAQKAIDACWAISQKDRDSGVTSRMRQGTIDSATCMEKHIIELSDNILFKDNPEAQKKVKESLGYIKKGVGRLYWDLSNNHDGCPCGTMYQLFHNSEVADIMEQIVKDFYKKIGEYNLYNSSLPR